MTKQEIITKLQNQKDARLQKMRIAKIVYQALIEWGDKQLSKRLETFVQDKLDAVYGTTPFDGTNWKGKTYMSNMPIAFHKDSSFSSPRYGLTVYARINGENEQIGTSYAYDVEGLKQAFKFDDEAIDENLQAFDRAVKEIDKILEAQAVIKSQIDTYNAYMQSFGSVKYSIEEFTVNLRKMI